MLPPDSPSRVDVRPLFLCMVGLVVLNVSFVQLTEAASAAWLAPLYALALAAPFLARFRESRVWRALWNLGVVGFLGVLVQHALSRDLSSVLEDGLILALLSQVHLLNNLHEEQRPDLLFINSYLIAIITGYITEDLGFAAAFFLYVPFFVLGLQYLSVARPGQRLGEREARAVFWDGALRTVVLTALALLVFLFWPRDFQRQPLFAQYFDFTKSENKARVGFTDSLDLERSVGTRGAQEEYVARVQVVGDPERASEIPALWRGAVLESVDAEGAWRSAGEMETAQAFGLEVDAGGSALVRPGQRAAQAGGHHAGSLWVRVEGLAPTRRLFVPEGASGVTLVEARANGTAAGRHDSQSVFGSAAGGGARATTAGPLRYIVELPARDADGESRAVLPLIPEERARLLEHGTSIHTRATVELGARIVREGQPAAEAAQRLSNYLSGRYRYRPPGTGGAGSLHAFVTGEEGGHCEFFASSLALMLRANGVPARVVTGFRVEPLDAQDGVLIIRSSDAHAWVEAFDPELGWQTFDPSPSFEGEESAPGLFARARAALAESWKAVTGFDAEARARAVAWMRGAPAVLVQWARSHPWASSGLLGLVAVAFVFLRRRRMNRTPRSVRALLRGFEEAGVSVEAGETPRETLARASERHGELKAADLETLKGLVEAHERDRYAA